MSTGAKRKVLVTGAAGLVASQVLPALRERYDLTLLDIQESDRQGQTIGGINIVDLANRDRDTYRHYFTKAYAVVHLGLGKSSAGIPDDQFCVELRNIQMTYNVYQTSLEEDVRRVVVASSNHAADYFEPLILDGKWDHLEPDGRALS